MRVFTVFLGVLLLIFALPLPAAELGPGAGTSPAQCSLEGTWFGGGDPHTPYFMTIIDEGAGRYTGFWELILAPGTPPYLSISPWSGDVVRVGPNKFETWVVLFAIRNPEFAEPGVDVEHPELQYAHSYLEFNEDCSTVTNVVDLYNGYVNWDFSKVPFVTPPDWIALGQGESIGEIYYRMPSDGHQGTAGRPVVNEGGGTTWTMPVDPRRLLRR